MPALRIDSLERMVAVRDCEDLIVRYAQLIDFGAPGRVWELFAEDGVWEMPLEGLRFAGHDELRTQVPAHLADDARTTRHVCTNVDITLSGPDTAEGFCYFVNFRHDFDETVSTSEDGIRTLAPTGSPRYVGEYVDRFVLTRDGWRFAHRRVQLGFSHRA